MVLKYGPLTQVWTMRFEAKHRMSKIVARSSFNRVNICKTVALKIQLVLNDMLIKRKLPATFACAKRVPTNGATTGSFSQKQLIPTEKKVFSVRWVKIKGNKLQISSIITMDL